MTNLNITHIIALAAGALLAHLSQRSARDAADQAISWLFHRPLHVPAASAQKLETILRAPSGVVGDVEDLIARAAAAAADAAIARITPPRGA
ncbi:MAG: hypothetical protein KGJ62_15445 [Armatimonadetes bacterium]|nr:hypothetical protein [Armatimonadota bacterium]MDE2207482.1 hypothetical protein [Armatimonadota bacterium]